MKSHRGISFLSVRESSPPSVEASLSLTFHTSPLRQVSWEKASPAQTMVLMGTSASGCWSGAPSESGLQMVLNVGDWGAVPSVPCPLPGPVKPNRICHKSGSQRGLWWWWWWGEVCAHRAAWLVHCRLACAPPGEQATACLCRGHRLQMGLLGLQNKAGLPLMENTIRQGKCSEIFM